MRSLLLLALLATVTTAQAQNNYEITVESKQPSGIINEMLYGQLFEHIYFSANNGVWQELIQERSFEPEQAFIRATAISTVGLWMTTRCCTPQPVTSSRCR